MPLTAFSISAGKELDVSQLLQLLAERDQVPLPNSSENLPDAWRQLIRTDIECPCCFVVGAEIVREAMSRGTGKPIRQPCFRFSSPSHQPLCDFAQTESSNIVPENLVAFGSQKSALTRAVRELVCRGIELGIFSQKTVRDMRKWFFGIKNDSLFTITLDAKIPQWIYQLWRISAHRSEELPDEVELTPRISEMPQFHWRAEATRMLRQRHTTILKVVQSERLWLHDGLASRIESLARRYHGQVVFDPTLLQKEYAATKSLAIFISHNFSNSMISQHHKEITNSVLALAALLLFVSDWDLSIAIEKFAKIAAISASSDYDLGNVMGLNPFHNFDAWAQLKRLQSLDISLPENADLKAELDQLEAEIRTRFAR